ncbi:MAG: shikimate dehydrogenase [Clostridia bacterium]
MKIESFAVVGHPISHTMSPFIHKVLFSLSGFSPKYDVLDIADLKESKDILKKYDGLNVTIPHKSGIIELLSEIDETAERYFSVNTVKTENGKMHGFTTDGAGALEAIGNAGGNFLSNTLIIGNGGASRAIAFELQKYNGKITLAGRDIKKAQVLADELKNAKAVLISDIENSDEKFDLLINATSVGMYPKSDATVVSENVVKRCETVFDAVYNPHETVLLKTAKSLGKNCVHGMDMLVYQAVVAHKIWYGAKFERKDILKLIDDASKACAEKFRN